MYAAVARRVPAALQGAVEAGFRSTTITASGLGPLERSRWIESELLGVLLTATFGAIEPVGAPVNVAEVIGWEVYSHGF